MTTPDPFETLADRWSLEVGEPFREGRTAWTAPVTLVTGDDGVLKISASIEEARREAEVLDLWNGDGAVRLLRSDCDRRALLLERCTPGTALRHAGLGAHAALTAAASVARRLWRAPLPTTTLPTVVSVTTAWACVVREQMEEHRPPFDRGFVELGATLLESLPSTSTRDLVVHGDLNPRNILRSQHDAWLAIDPEPMIGDPAFDPAALIAEVAPLSDDAELARRYHLFSDLTGLPTERMAAWAAGRFVHAALRQVVRDPSWARGAIAVARDYATLAGV